jgi:hypothetical protein
LYRLAVKRYRHFGFGERRMQVEVSKYTEGVNDKALRPNGLPKSLIRYDGLCS